MIFPDYIVAVMVFIIMMLIRTYLNRGRKMTSQKAMIAQLQTLRNQLGDPFRLEEESYDVNMKLVGEKDSD